MNPKTDLEAGDKIIVEWSDGLIDHGTFVGVERGYIVFIDTTGRRGALASAHGNVVLVEKASRNE